MSCLEARTARITCTVIIGNASSDVISYSTPTLGYPVMPLLLVGMDTMLTIMSSQVNIEGRKKENHIFGAYYFFLAFPPSTVVEPALTVT